MVTTWKSMFIKSKTLEMEYTNTYNSLNDSFVSGRSSKWALTIPRWASSPHPLLPRNPTPGPNRASSGVWWTGTQDPLILTTSHRGWQTNRYSTSVLCNKYMTVDSGCKVYLSGEIFLTTTGNTYTDSCRRKSVFSCLYI